MKRSVLLGLFVTASMLASTSFAATKDECTENIHTIENAKAQYATMDIRSQVEASLAKAKALNAQNTDQSSKECIVETTQTIQLLRNASHDSKG
ncbi:MULTISPECIES: hypothetical protein [Pseudomonas]|uniref:Uncharacterized protein n=1 Tax=Pseudomonas fluorescens R124 TaxID=743713 RepID=A0A7U9CJM3_PSEFL|nr:MULTISPECIES: hypothetical protein [Pseudomonas]EJZ56448.1 hypothetical protein I1A_000756 [Pseudomonas fluorescens R124]MBK5340428.1 hypothetical protein [Pseudomonas sp. TH49]RBL71948.1 hypothetical protein C3E98_010155 [Pseudomonas sp. MWU13-2625]